MENKHSFNTHDPVVKLPSAILREVALPVQKFNSTELNDLIQKMFAVMHEKNGVGIAAPQLGVSLRIFVYGFDKSPRYPDAPGVPKDVAINPEIIWQSDELIPGDEGCLSVPFKRGTVARSKAVTLKYMDVIGNSHEKTLYDFAARIVQHEIDHLNGILYIDRATEIHDSELI